jgi:predicted RNA-binding Zn ribbon-like protein
MMSQLQTPPKRVDPPFKYIGGDPALDLVNTVDWTSRGPENDRLTDFGRLISWAEGAGIVSSKAAAALRKRAAARPGEAAAAHHHALETRAALARLFGRMAAGRAGSRDLHDFNRLLGPPLEQMRLLPATTPGGQELQLGWEEKENRLESVVWPVLWSAARLLTSDEATQIRVCGGEDCGWMYVDRSRNGLRRWCQMETCGTREKSRKRAAAGKR